MKQLTIKKAIEAQQTLTEGQIKEIIQSLQNDLVKWENRLQALLEAPEEDVEIHE